MPAPTVLTRWGRAAGCPTSPACRKNTCLSLTLNNFFSHLLTACPTLTATSPSLLWMFLARASACNITLARTELNIFNLWRDSPPAGPKLTKCVSHGGDIAGQPAQVLRVQRQGPLGHLLGLKRVKLCSLFIKPEVMKDTNLLYDRSQASLPHTTLDVFIIYCYF